MNALDEAREHVEVANQISSSEWATDHHLKLAVAKAHIAQVEAIERQTEQLSIANKLAVAHIDAVTEAAGIAEHFPIREYLTGDEWKGLDL